MFLLWNQYLVANTYNWRPIRNLGKWFELMKVEHLWRFSLTCSPMVAWNLDSCIASAKSADDVVLPSVFAFEIHVCSTAYHQNYRLAPEMVICNETQKQNKCYVIKSPIVCCFLSIIYRFFLFKSKVKSLWKNLCLFISMNVESIECCVKGLWRHLVGESRW